MADLPFMGLLRPDIRVVLQPDGRCLLRDPLTAQFFQLSILQQTVLNAVVAGRSEAEIVQRLQSTNTAWTEIDLRLLVRDLQQSGLLRVGSSSGSTLSKRGPGGNLLQGFGRILRAVMAVLVLRLTIRRAVPLAVLLARPLQWFACSIGRAVSLLILTTAACTLAWKGTDFLASLPDPVRMLRRDVLLPFALALVLMKVIHECGHIAAGTLSGVRVRQVGITVMFGMPLPWVDLTDAWVLDRRRRMLISAGGMAAELLLASAAVICWQWGPTEWIRIVSVRIVLLTLVSILIWNGNPLNRFDGYYLLSDLLRRPQLRTDAARQLPEWLAGKSRSLHLMLFRPAPVECFDVPVLLYGVAAAVYRCVVSLLLAGFLYSIFEGIGAPAAGGFIAGLAIAAMVVRPLGQFAADFAGHVLSQQTCPDGDPTFLSAGGDERRTETGAKSGLFRRPWMWLLLILVGVCCIPVHSTMVCPAVIAPGGTAVRAMATGIVVQRQSWGREIQADDLLVQLKNPELQALRYAAEFRLAVAEAELRVAELTAPSEVSLAADSVHLARTEVERLVREEAALRHTASQAGVWIPAGGEDDGLADGELTGRLGGIEPGVLVERGELLGYQSRTDGAVVRFYVPIDSGFSPRVGQRMSFEWREAGGNGIPGRVVEAGGMRAVQVPGQLAIDFGMTAEEAVAEGYLLVEAWCPQADSIRGGAVPIRTRGRVLLQSESQPLIVAIRKAVVAIFRQR